jgi:phage replication O-like protein O
VGGDRGRPQLEDGYLRLANELVEVLARTSLNGYETRCMFYLIRKTYGYNKKSDQIPLSQWAKGTYLQVPHISRTLAGLVKRRIFTKIGNKWALNKNYSEWRELPKLVKGGKVTKNGSRVTNNGKKKLPKQVSSINNKDNTQKTVGEVTNFGKSITLCHKCQKGFEPKYPNHTLCYSCFKASKEHPTTALPDCPNPNCHIKSPHQRIDLKLKGCNFCMPEEID